MESFLSTCNTHIEAVRELAKVVNPDTSPFESKYAIRSHLVAMRTQLIELIRSCADDDQQQLPAQMHNFALVLSFCLGENYASSEEPHNGDANFQMIVSILDRKWFESFCAEQSFVAGMGNDKDAQTLHELLLNVECKPNTRLLLLSLKHLGIIWANREQPAFARQLFLRILHLDDACDEESIAAQEAFFADPHLWLVDGGVSLESMASCLTHTYFYMAQVADKPHDAAHYCLVTLVRQRQDDSYDAFEWSKSVLNLSTYFRQNNEFGPALNCIAACRQNSATLVATDETVYTDDDLAKLRADADKYTGLIVSMVLEQAAMYLVKAWQPPAKSNQDEQQEDEMDTLVLVKDHGSILRLEDPTEVVTQEQAVALFKTGFRHLKSALDYYVLDGFVSDHVDLLARTSSLYKSLTFFDHDCKRRAALYTRRDDLLSPLLDQLNVAVYRVELQELSHELGEIAMGLFQEHEKRGEIASKKTNGVSRISDDLRVNSAATKAISYYKKFIDVCDTKEESFTENLLKAYLQAHLHIARMYTKIRCREDKRETLKNTTKSLEFYKKVIAEADALIPESDRDMFKEERELASEMVELLPMSMNMTMQQMQQAA